MNNWLQAGDLYKWVMYTGRGGGGGGGEGEGEKKDDKGKKDKLHREEKICFLLSQMFEVVLNNNVQ